MSPLEDPSLSPLPPPKVNTRRNTMAASALDGGQLKMIRRSARVIAKKTEWECEDMPPPSPISTKRAMSVKKSTAKKPLRKTLVCGDDEEHFNAAKSPPKVAQLNFVSAPRPNESDEDTANETPVIPQPSEVLNESSGEKKNGTFEISKENMNDVSGVDLLTEDETDSLPSISMLGAQLKASKIQSSDSETENLLSVSALGAVRHASESDQENLAAAAKPKTKTASKSSITVAAKKKSRSTRKTLVVSRDTDGASTDDAIIDSPKAPKTSEDDRSNNEKNKTAPVETSLQPAEAVNDEKKNGTFDVSKENVNADVSGTNLLTEDESDAEEKQNLPSVSMLGIGPKKNKTAEIANSDSEHENLPSVSMLANASIKKVKKEHRNNTRISIVDLTDSPAVKKTGPTNEMTTDDAESAVTAKVNDKTFSPVESTASVQSATSILLTLPAAEKSTKNPNPSKLHTPLKRKSPRLSNGPSKRPLTSAKKKCLLSMAKEAIAERKSNKQVAFNSPSTDRTRTPKRGLSMGIKKTPYRLPAEGNFFFTKLSIYSKSLIIPLYCAVNTSNENEEPKTSNAGVAPKTPTAGVAPKTPGKMPDFSKMHQKLFANMESLDSAVIRVDERAKELM